LTNSTLVRPKGHSCSSALQEFSNTTYKQSIKFLTPKKIQNIIQEDLNPRKAPGYGLIKGKILKEMPRKGIVHLTTIGNTTVRTGYSPVQWKVALIIMIPKPGKPPEEAYSQ
jgi:hypothetical protein